MGKTSRTIAYDAAQFVSVEHGFVLPPRPGIWPKNLKGIRECIESAIYMASQIELCEHGLSSFRLERVRAAYFRASLTELCRIEDILKSLDQSFSFYTARDPSLHLVKLLRNYQVHIASSAVTAGQVVVKLAGEPMLYRSYIAEDVDVPGLRKLDSSKPYTDSQLCEILELFESSQRKFGISQFLYHLAKQVEAFARRALTNRSTRTLPLPVISTTATRRIGSAG